MYSKPPLGIEPHDIWLEHRAAELLNAIVRYYNYKGITSIPEKWVQELHDLLILIKKDQ